MKKLNRNIYKSIIFYVIGIILLYISILISHYFKYNDNFVSALPLILPIVFALVFFSMSVLFIITRNYPYLFRTGIMSLVSGITLFVFGMVSFRFKVSYVIWSGSLGIGILFILVGIVRLIIQGGLITYKKSKG